MARLKTVTWIVMLALVLMSFLSFAPAFAQESPSDKPAAAAETQDRSVAIAFSIAIVVAAACIAAGYAVGRVGSAALGAASERPELLGRSLILVGLAEGIAIYGLIVGIMLLGKLK